MRALKEDLEAFEELIKNPDSNLYAQIPWGKKDQTLLREVLVGCRSQQLPHRGVGFAASHPWRLEGLTVYFQLTASCQRI